jgi:sensor histidine kinase YesM
MNFGYGIFVVSYALTSLLGSNVSSAITIPNATNFTMPKTFEEAALKCASGDTSIPSGVCSVVNLVSQQLEQRRQEQEAQKKALAEQQAQLAEQRRQMEEQAKQQQQNSIKMTYPCFTGWDLKCTRRKSSVISKCNKRWQNWTDICNLLWS